MFSNFFCIAGRYDIKDVILFAEYLLCAFVDLNRRDVDWTKHTNQNT